MQRLFSFPFRSPPLYLPHQQPSVSVSLGLTLVSASCSRFWGTCRRFSPISIVFFHSCSSLCPYLSTPLRPVLVPRSPVPASDLSIPRLFLCQRSGDPRDTVVGGHVLPVPSHARVGHVVCTRTSVRMHRRRNVFSHGAMHTNGSTDVHACSRSADAEVPRGPG